MCIDKVALAGKASFSRYSLLITDVTELDYETFEQPIIRNNAELGFQILKNRVNDASRRHIPKRRPTINNPSFINNSTMMSNRLLEGGTEPMKQNEVSTMNKLSRNSLQLGEKFKGF